MIRVGVVGAAGRMGATVCDAVAAADGLELVAAIDVVGGGGSVHGLTIQKELKALADAKAEVVVDFTVAAAARQTLPWLALHGMHARHEPAAAGDERRRVHVLGKPQQLHAGLHPDVVGPAAQRPVGHSVGDAVHLPVRAPGGLLRDEAFVASPARLV
ncbi:MAG: hypothetical protein EBS32_06395, partial [Actinobacteria bacterium]|nr:hypothetical protein [Actinomycetota bacterium]